MEDQTDGRSKLMEDQTDAGSTFLLTGVLHYIYRKNKCYSLKNKRKNASKA